MSSSHIAARLAQTLLAVTIVLANGFLFHLSLVH